MKEKIESNDTKNTKKEEKPAITWKQRFNLIVDYFINSDEKLFAWLMLLGTVLGVVALVGLTAIGGWLFTGMWAALTANALMPFFIALGKFVGCLAIGAIVYFAQNYFKGTLTNAWRDWLSAKFIKKLFMDTDGKHKTKNYLEVLRTCPEMKDIPQRIQEDVPNFVESSLSLGTSFIKSSLSLGVFVGSLWVMGGSLAFIVLGLNIVIPGYLVWVAILVALAGGLITYGIGRVLPEIKQKGVQYEAEYRQHIESLNNNAENRALEGTEAKDLQSIEHSREAIAKNSNDKTLMQSILEGFQNFYSQVAIVIPLLCCLPLCLTGLIGIEQIGQISMYFMEVNNALGWFGESYEKLVTCKTSMDRIIEIDQSIDYANKKSNQKAIDVKDNQGSTSIIMKNLTIAKPTPSANNYIFRNLNLELIKKEHILILGDSGLGKSTFFKAIKGVWAYGQGGIEMPAGQKIAFYPQIPSMTNDTLMGLLSNPAPTKPYSKEDCLWALRAVKLDKYIPDLETKKDWSFFSGGEKQKIVFAKILLQRPDWLFLDEASSFLDEKSESYLYALISEQLENSTIVSIAHRSTVKPHHDRITTLGLNENNELVIIDDTRQKRKGVDKRVVDTDFDYGAGLRVI